MAPKRKKGVSIFARILIVFLCVNIATSGILLVVAFRFHRQSIEKRTKESITQQLEILRDNFEHDYRINLKRSLDVLASSLVLDDYLTVSEFEKVLLKKKIEQMFIQTLKTYRTYQSIRFVDADGDVNICVTGKFRQKETIRLEQVKLEPPDTLAPTLNATLKLFEILESIPLLLSGGYMEWFMPPRELQLEGPYMDEGKKLSLLAGISKLDLDVGAFGGVLMIQQRLEGFFEGLRDVIFFNENLIWVFDADGRLLQKPQKEENRFEPTGYLAEHFQQTPKLIDTEKGLVAYQDFSVIPGRPFIRVVISIPSTLLFKDSASTVRFFSILLACSLVIVLLVTLSVSRYLSKPITELAHAANRLAEGDLTAKVDVETSGEVQMLVNSFNQMTEELRQTILLNVRLDEASKRKDELERINRELEGAKQSLAEREERYRMLTGNLPGVVYRFDFKPTNNLTFFNEMLYPMTGYDDNDLVQAGVCALESMIVPEDIEIVTAIVENAVTKSEPFEIEYRVRHAGGQIRYFLERGRPVYNSGGEPKYIDGVILDVTERQAAKHEKEKLEAQLRQALKMEAIGTLAGGVAHDFNNILGIILGNTELAIEDIPDWNPASQNLIEIKIASLRAKDVVRQLLSFSRKTEQLKKPIQINDIVKESIKLLRASIPSTIAIELNIPEGAPTILADATQIHQVLINLCTNAAHAMEDKGGQLTVDVTTKHLAEGDISEYGHILPGNYVQIAVSDTGHGMLPEARKKMFDPYYTTKEIGKGTGMGLAVVHGIVKSHNGTIWVYSQPGKGTAIKALFPASNIPRVTEKTISEDSLKGDERILFIDDEVSLILLGRAILERLGYQVETRTNPKEAMALFRSNPTRFDLIITDMTMPRMTGTQVAREMLKINPDIPIILCTGFSEKINSQQALEIGIRKYIEKPLNKRELARAIREVLDERSAKRAAIRA